MALELRGNTYYIRLAINGQRVQKSCKTGDLKIAQALHKKVEAELILGSVSDSKVKGIPTLGEAYDNAMATVWRGHKSVSTVAINWKTVSRIVGSATRLDKVDEDALRKLVLEMAKEGAAPATINRKLSLVSTVLKQYGHLIRVPKMPLQKEYRGRVRYLSLGEEQTVLNWFKSRDDLEMYYSTMILLDTGMRLGELLRLEPQDIDMGAEDIHLWETKTDSPRTIPMTPRVIANVLQLVPVTLTKDIMEKRWAAMRKDIGLANDREFVIHALRHTCCTRLVKGNMDISKVQMWMGHKTIETTLRYKHLDTSDLRQGAAVLSTKVYQRATTGYGKSSSQKDQEGVVSGCSVDKPTNAEVAELVDALDLGSHNKPE